MEVGTRKGSGYRGPPGTVHHWMLVSGGKSDLLGTDDEEK